MPGDVIVVDECQRAFRPFASGRRIPKFIEKLETARHYGVQFVYITQGPALIHKNVRDLVGPHEHVRRVFGTSQTFVYQWDHCTHPDKIKTATRRSWRHKKAAFGLYKSAEVHTKFRTSMPLAVYLVAGAVLFLVGTSFSTFQRFKERFGGAQAQEAAASAPKHSNLKTAESGQPGRGDSNGSSTQSRAQWPVLNVAPAVIEREPFHDRGLVLDGWYRVGQRVSYQFGLVVDGTRVATLTGQNLLAAGYAIREVAPCAVVLVFGDRERSVTCAPARALPSAPGASTPGGSA
jgi:zona occludens toxin (predicted ATPase)